MISGSPCRLECKSILRKFRFCSAMPFASLGKCFTRLIRWLKPSQLLCHCNHDSHNTGCSLTRLRAVFTKAQIWLFRSVCSLSMAYTLYFYWLIGYYEMTAFVTQVTRSQDVSLQGFSVRLIKTIAAYSTNLVEWNISKMEHQIFVRNYSRTTTWGRNN